MKQENKLEEKMRGLTKVYKKGREVIPYCVKDYSNCFKDSKCYYYREYVIKGGENE